MPWAGVYGLFGVTAFGDGWGANACLFHMAVAQAAPHAFQNYAKTAHRRASKALETLCQSPNLARYMFT